jgi:hypothetical protein
MNHIVQAITDRFDQEDFVVYLDTEQLLLKCVRGENYQREVKLVSEFYSGEIHEANLQCQLNRDGSFLLRGSSGVSTDLCSAFMTTFSQNKSKH